MRYAVREGGERVSGQIAQQQHHLLGNLQPPVFLASPNPALIHASLLLPCERFRGAYLYAS